MDVDEEPNGDGNAYPSPEQLPSPVVITNGPEKGTQVDKISELTAETTFLDLSDDSPSRNTILLQCEFNPRDPTILAAAGTDALARMWTFSRTAADLDVQPPHHNLLGDGLPPNTTATGLSWSSDGLSVAIASEPVESETARIEVWNVDGTSIASFDSFESPIINLRWNLSNTLLLALSPEARGTLITVMSPTTQDTLQHSLPGHVLIDQPLDAAWTSNDEFVLCGGDLLRAFHCAEGSISPVRKYETREGHALSKFAFDWPSRLLATASDTGMIDVSYTMIFQGRFTDTWTDLGSTRSISFLQCASRSCYLLDLAANLLPFGIS
jgi:WD40 repeat protein